MAEEHPFQPGVEVAIVSRGWGVKSYTLGKVAKVHKSGRFVLQGSSQQYRASRNWSDKRWQGSATGDSRYSFIIELVTDELREEVAASNRKKRFRDIAYKFEKERSLAERITDEQIADLERIYAELTAKETA